MKLIAIDEARVRTKACTQSGTIYVNPDKIVCMRRDPDNGKYLMYLDYVGVVEITKRSYDVSLAYLH